MSELEHHPAQHPEKHEGGHGEHHLPWWLEGLHNVQRTMENGHVAGVEMPELWEHMRHSAQAGHAANSTAHVAGTVSASEHAATATQATEAVAQATEAVTQAPKAVTAAAQAAPLKT